MQISHEKFSALDLINMVKHNKLNPDPIGQRPPVSQGPKKSQGIMASVLSGEGLPSFCLRDIRNDEKMQKIYPSFDYIVVDGGHRMRALVQYFDNRFSVNGKKYKDTNVDLSKITFMVDITVCTSREAINKFRNWNKCSPSNFMESLMADDESEICKEARSLTTSYKEYNNDAHELFEVTYDRRSGEEKSVWFNMAPNHRRKWDEYALIAMIKAIGKGNVSAGQSQIQALIDQEYEGNNPVTKSVIKTVTRMFDDALDYQQARGKSYKLNTDIFAAFQNVWFGLYEANRNFKIDDPELFKDAFMEAYVRLTSTRDTSYDDELITYKGETTSIKTFIRSNMTNFANAGVQKVCAKRFIEELGDLDDCGVIFRDAKRSLTTAQREEQLALQGYVCAIDKKPLKLEDSVWAHNVAWAKGGSTSDGAVIRRSTNLEMGQTTLDEFSAIIEKRSKKGK